MTTLHYKSFGGALTNSSQPFGAFGRESDVESGLNFHRARYLDPSTGRFLQRDRFTGSKFTPRSYHKYLYAYGNPLVYSDPDGQCPVFTAFLRWALKQVVKQAGKRTGNKAAQPEFGDPAELDDDGDGKPNFKDPNSPMCEINCTPEPEKPKPEPDPSKLICPLGPSSTEPLCQVQ